MRLHFHTYFRSAVLRGVPFCEKPEEANLLFYSISRSNQLELRYWLKICIDVSTLRSYS